MWCEIGHDLSARYKLVADTFEVVRLHDGGHHPAVDRERHIDEVALDQCRPVLVAHRMSQFDAGAHRHLRREARQFVQVHDHDVAHLDARDKGRKRLRVPEEHVAIPEVRAAIDGDGNFGALCGQLAEAALLRLPLVDLQHVDLGRSQPTGPFRIAYIAEYGFNDDHDTLFS
jgi:hypothetical protein